MQNIAEVNVMLGGSKTYLTTSQQQAAYGSLQVLRYTG